MRLMDGLRFALGTLSVLPVRVERVDRQVAGQAMALAPAVGLLLGLLAGLALLLPAPPLLGAVLALGLLALLTRGLHLDGLADLADGLGSGKPSDQALDIMKKSDIGPFGVMTLVLMLLAQVVALADAGLWALVTACVAGRLALTWACRSGVPAARPDGLGATVAGTVHRPAVWLATVAALLATAVIGLLSAPGTGLWAWDGSDEPTRELTAHYPCMVGSCPPVDDPHPWKGVGMASQFVDVDMVAVSGGSGGLDGLSGVVVAPVALLAGLGAALLLLAHARRRLGGITGDVLGALVETATAATLVVYAILG
ncbi:adenosylcobinamide-GDP ribazoletransferase [Nonomuraea rubra]|uniref:Adenosylcobinamide-GDP ribazoletransferase n=1 Tax=Nonomuraea rubra TaxID=46180 RepID=A0A7X0P0J3_9ACTN|nr:adenosylcobinamide-GDP ribazoletransferase [Nonomuraea rubra]MBB6553030.1 adenosylcobinamide-GDP ribazoletransferase [Nonomuraea rubra]